jgi:hypothetical protein
MAKLFTASKDQPHTEIIRLQHKDTGYGPYTADHEDVENIMADSSLPSPQQSLGFDDSDIRHLEDPRIPKKFGFLNEDMMRRSISDKQLAQLKEHGYEPVKIKAAHVWGDKNQVFYSTPEQHAEREAQLKAVTLPQSEVDKRNKPMKKTFIDKLIALNELLNLRDDLMKADKPKYQAPKKDFRGPKPEKEGSFHGETHTAEHLNGHRKVSGSFEDKSTGETRFANRHVDNKVQTTHVWDHKNKKWNHHKTEHRLGGLNVDGTKKGPTVDVSDSEKKKMEERMNQAAAKDKEQSKKFRTATRPQGRKDTASELARIKSKAEDKKKPAEKKKPKTILRRGLKKTQEIREKLEEFKKAMKQGGLGGPGSVKAGAMLPSMPKMPKPGHNSIASSTGIPGIKQPSKKNPIKSAEQTQNPDIKDMKMREAQEMLTKPSVLKFDDNGQWSLD